MVISRRHTRHSTSALDEAFKHRSITFHSVSPSFKSQLNQTSYNRLGQHSRLYKVSLTSWRGLRSTVEALLVPTQQPPGSNPGSTEIFSPYCLVCGQY